jgi:hypothetical protein
MNFLRVHERLIINNIYIVAEMYIILYKLRKKWNYWRFLEKKTTLKSFKNITFVFFTYLLVFFLQKIFDGM